MPDDFDPYLNWLGIEPHERPLDHYRLLGLARFEHRRDVIKGAADQRMAYIRSFQSGPRVSHTQRLLNELATAKLCLLDAGAKAGYDAALQSQLFPPAAPPAPPVYTPHEYLAVPLAEPPVAGGPTKPQPSVSSATYVVDSPVQPDPTSAEKSESDAKPDDDSPVYTRPWFPLAAVASLLVVAGMIWGIGKYLNRPHETSGPIKPTNEGEVSPIDEPPVDPTPDPATSTMIEQDESGEILFSAESAELHGNLQFDSRGGAQVVSNWMSEEDELSWTFHVKRPQFFRVEISYAAASDSAGGRYEITVDEDRRTGEIRSAARPDDFVTDQLILVIRNGGRHVLTLRAAEMRGKELFVFKSLRLRPRTGSAGN